MGEARHTAGPWEQHGVWLFGRGTAVAKMRYGGSDEPGLDAAKANAARIVQCVNAHDELVGALVAVMGRVQPDLERADPAMNRAMATARAALAKASA